MNTRRRIKLGELLVQQQVISEKQLQQALVEQRRSGRKLGRVLADLGFVSESSLLDFLSRQLQVPFVDLKQIRLDREVVKLLPEPLRRLIGDLSDRERVLSGLDIVPKPRPSR